MIASLNGKKIFSDTNTAIIECGGVGLKCNISLKTAADLPAVGATAFLHTHMVVREDAIELFGFSTIEELDCFKLITSVNGVGPKIGIAILSEFTPDKLKMFIASGDAKALTAASGVGIKLAQRIVLELKDKFGKDLDGNIDASNTAVFDTKTPSNASDAIAALVSLGFSRSEASLAVSKLDPASSADELIKNALKYL